MTLEFFGETLILGRQGISGTEIPSAKHHSFAKMACGVAYPDLLPRELRKEINIVYVDTI